MAKKKYVYSFTEGHGVSKNIIGGKGSGLAEMVNIGVPIPQGFTVTTEACLVYNESGKTLPKELEAEIYAAVKNLEKETGKSFGGKKNPLLVSVRSGARVSMPGMMDTVLNLGLNDDTAVVLEKETQNPRFVADTYRRFIVMYTNVVVGLPRDDMDKMLDDLKDEKGYKDDTEITTEELKHLTQLYKEYYKQQTGSEFPTDPYVQLLEAVKAVFSSWDNPRADYYRKMNNIPYAWGTAANVQSMVYGNKGNTSGTGVGFTRNPATGEKIVYAEYLPNAQGEDIVAGIRTPYHIDYLAEQMPEVYKQFVATCDLLEHHYTDMQDVEFTVEEGKLYFLQTRSGKRTSPAALRIACELIDEGLIDEKTAVLRIDPRTLDTLLHPHFEEKALKSAPVLGTGLAASPGAGVGKLAFSAEEAERRHKKGENVILVRIETSPEDIAGMDKAEAILTLRGGMTSHAAVVARGMGRACIVGLQNATIDMKARTLSVGGKVFGENDVISVDGTTGHIYDGAIATIPADLDSGYFGRIMGYADKYRRLEVRTNADTPHDAQQALDFGAQGIGLTRTEHMFFHPDRIKSMRKMILSDNVKDREAALAEILPSQREDFYNLYVTMGGLPVTIRLLDPPLHEFLPTDDKLIEELAKDLGVSVAAVKDRIAGLHEVNPMMGHRGLRLAVTYPEIAKMQTTAIIEAAIKAQKHLGKPITPEIMIPLTSEVKEYAYVKKVVVATADEIIAREGVKLTYHVGTMLEIPRAALTADKIAKEAEFFSFGTNDLTQMTFGFSRDDAAKFLPEYYENRILEQDPFKTIDQEGVGQLVKMAAERGRAANPHLHLGVCGEHGGEPDSVEFFHRVGLDYVSCSPFRVPTARLSAAQASIKEERGL